MSLSRTSCNINMPLLSIVSLPSPALGLLSFASSSLSFPTHQGPSVDILNPITALLRVCSFPSLFLFSQLTLSLIHHYQLAWLPTFFFRERYSLLLDGIIWTIILFSSSWPVRSFFFYQPSDLFLDSPFAFLIPFLDDLVTLPLQPRRAPSLLRSLPKRDDFDSSAASPACSSYEHRLLLRPSILGTHRLVEQLNHSVQFLVGTEARTTDTWK